MTTPIYLESFGESPQLQWETVNDVVMGGISKSTFRIEDQKGQFRGRVSLENNGGFASVRASVPDPLSEKARGLRIRVSGDGQQYSFRIRLSGPYSRVAYRADFSTVTRNWEEHWFPWNTFRPTYRGRNLSEVPLPHPAQLREVGFIIANRQAGPFTLAIDYIRAE